MKEKRGHGLNGIKSLIVHGAHRTDYYFCCLSPRGICMYANAYRARVLAYIFIRAAPGISCHFCMSVCAYVTRTRTLRPTRVNEHC